MKPQAYRPEFEALEDRVVPTSTRIVLDFTHDYRGTSLWRTMLHETRYTDGTAPSFLDINKDGRVTSADVPRAAEQIGYQVHRYFSAFAGMNVKVVAGDATVSSNFGYRYLKYGRADSNVQVLVNYLGGRNAHEPTIYGKAPRAKPGYNVEGFSETYTTAIALNLARQHLSSAVTSGEFVREVASTAAHEIGHMLGLRHATSGPEDNVMRTANQTYTTDHFVNASVYVEGGGWQNAWSELIRSFRGQPQYWGTNSESYDRASHSDAGHEAEALHCCTDAAESEHDAHDLARPKSRAAGATVKPSAPAPSAQPRAVASAPEIALKNAAHQADEWVDQLAAVLARRSK